jgi:putative transposase
VGFLREADADVAVKDLCRKHGFSDGSYYLWRSKCGGIERLPREATDGARGRKHAAEEAGGGLVRENEITREALRRKW